MYFYCVCSIDKLFSKQIFRNDSSFFTSLLFKLPLQVVNIYFLHLKSETFQNIYDLILCLFGFFFTGNVSIIIFFIFCQGLAFFISPEGVIQN